MVRVELTQKEIILIQGALSISSKDEFGNDLELFNNQIEECEKCYKEFKLIKEVALN